MNRIILIITVIATATMELIDTSIVNVALNYMSGNLGATIEDTSWVVTAYGIANVIIIPMTSFLVNNLGRRNYYIGSIIAFTMFSLLCGMSGNIWELVAFRFLQGLAGGALLSVSAMVVYESFPKEKQNVASAIFGIGVFIGPTIGPTLGGYITEHISWPWVFFINVPIGILAAASSLRLLPESPTREPAKSVDWPGIIYLVIGIGALQTVLERGEVDDWFDARYIVVLSVAAVIALVLFVRRELTTPHPVVKLSVMKEPSLAISTLLTFITGIGMFTSIYLTPVLAQRFLGYGPEKAGLLLLTGSIIAVFTLIVTSKALQKGVPITLIILIGFICFIYFNWSMSNITTDVSFRAISNNLIFRAVAMAVLTVPLATLAVSALAPKDMQQGAAINNMMRQLGGSFGIAILNTYVTRNIARHRVDLISNIRYDNPQLTERLNRYTALFQSRGLGLADARQRALALVDMSVVKQAGFMSYLDGYRFVGFLFLLAVPLLLFFVKKKKQKITIVAADH